MIFKTITLNAKKFILGLVVLFFFLCGSFFVLQTQIEAPAASLSESLQLPIIMYHHINPRKGTQGDYVITPGQLEKDLQYIKNKGYTTINMTDLINYVYHQAPLPDKPIILTFDDGYASNYFYAYPLFLKYQMKGVISVIGRYSEIFSTIEDHNVNYSYLSWDEVKELNDSQVFEIQNHTYDLHTLDCGRKGCMKKRGEDTETYQQFLKKDLSLLQEKLKEVAGITPNTFTYPFGFISEESRPIIKEMGFLASLSCETRINQITSDFECLYDLGRFNRAHGKSSAQFFKNILV